MKFPHISLVDLVGAWLKSLDAIHHGLVSLEHFYSGKVLWKHSVVASTPSHELSNGSPFLESACFDSLVLTLNHMLMEALGEYWKGKGVTIFFKVQLCLVVLLVDGIVGLWKPFIETGRLGRRQLAFIRLHLFFISIITKSKWSCLKHCFRLFSLICQCNNGTLFVGASFYPVRSFWSLELRVRWK